MIVTLPADLFAPTNTPILHLETLSKLALNTPTRCHTLTLTRPQYDNTSMDPLEADVLEAQLHDTAMLHCWKGAHGINYRPGGLWWKNDALVVTIMDLWAANYVSPFIRFDPDSLRTHSDCHEATYAYRSTYIRLLMLCHAY
jgi:hypothetical protein